MAVGKSNWPDNMFPIAGLKLGVAKAEIKSSGGDDLLVVAMEDGASVAGVFTQNAFAAEPVKMAKQHMSQASPRFFVINSGNANACTGQPGWDAALHCCATLAAQMGVQTEQVIPFSTGVVGEVLPSEKISKAIPKAINMLDESAWLRAAQAIMTTDTRPKGASVKLDCNGKAIHITGIAKGAGMINPNMATMLAFVATDAAIAPDLLQKISEDAANKSFNRITIDGDTSTNDACMLVATGQSGADLDETDKDAYQALVNGIISIHKSLAQQVVKDAEGATKYVEVRVEDGANSQECFDVAYAVAHSPLVKTALYASDPNWGRIVVAIGYAGVDGLDSSRVKVWLDDVCIVENGGRASTYTEEQGQAVVDNEEFVIRISLGRGDVCENLWTSDLSHEYVKINAEYRT